ncbi:uncharacterized protein LOC121367434 isoform X1 [Gigantopelta aegis]|uniref:uncharacterized protein LOC121367434 isoform X1 n=1 Tax=Gigantopelta aegis TaxID=1735272 RepID=UPI001B88BF0C|nr:uncharacterized protein LOC121367434 isoform X1 [Gigantopelta aegis]
MDRTTKAIVLLCVHVCLVHGYTTPTKELNMESSDCDHAGDYTVTDLDIVKVWANPPFQNAGSGSRDRCVIRLRAELGNRRLFVYVTDVLFNDRGIQLKVYDSTSSAHPRHVLTSDDGPGMRWELKTSVMFELVKQSTSARTYKFSIMVTTDQGPNIDFEQNVNEYYGQTLTIGAIVGLAIGGGLIFLALVGIAIYCIIKHRRKRLSKEREAGSTNAGSTVYSSSKEKYYNDSKVHIGRDFIPPKPSPSTRTYSQVSQSDHKESDIFIVKDQYGRHPATFKNDAFSRDSSSGGYPVEHNKFRRDTPKRHSMEKSKEFPVYDDYDRARQGRDSKPQSEKSGEFKRADPKRQSAGKSRRYPASDDDMDGRNYKKQSAVTNDVRRETSKRQPSEKGSYRQEGNAKRQQSKYDEYDYPHGTYSRRDDRHSGKYEDFEFPRERESRPRNRSTRDDRSSTKYEDFEFPRGSQSRGHSVRKDDVRRDNSRRQSAGRDSRREGGSVPRRSQSPYRDNSRPRRHTESPYWDNSHPRRHAERETRPSPGSVRRQTPERSSSRDRDTGSRKEKQSKTLGDLNINARYGNRGQIPKR